MFASQALVGRTVLINGERVKVTQVENVVNFQRVLINRKIEMSYAEMEALKDAPAEVPAPRAAPAHKAEVKLEPVKAVPATKAD